MANENRIIIDVEGKKALNAMYEKTVINTLCAHKQRALARFKKTTKREKETHKNNNKIN